MDIQAMRSLLELNAMRSLSTNNSQSNFSESDHSLFNELLNELLNSSENGTIDSTKLGTVVSQLSNTSFFESTEGQALLTNNPYLAQFLLNEESAAMLNQHNASTGDSKLVGAEKFSEEISAAAAKYNVPEKLIAAVIKQESNFNPNAVSRAGASGLMQLMPQTAKYLGVTDVQNPEQNIMAGAKYLRQMLDKFDNNTELALAAYNAGPNNVLKYNGIPPFKETQNYVKKVMQYFES